MAFKIGLPMLASFILSTVLMKLLIPVLHKFKFGQEIRKELTQEHQVKKGTPTMGAIAYLIAITVVTVASCLILKANLLIWLPILLITLGFGIIGFLDDFLKIKKKQSEGLKAWQKLALQIVLALGFSVYCYLSPVIGSKVLIPFMPGKTWDMKWLYIPFAFLAILGTDNGTNFTDGLDGLLGSVTTVIALFFMFLTRHSSVSVSVMSGIVAGALMGYLVFNTYPAKVFMGDTGSLAMGAFVSATALTLKMGWFILLFGLIYLIEVISVMLQVGYFKLTKGKRLFKMAPIHHHFELSGFSESRIVFLFTIFTAAMCALAYVALYY